MWGRCWYSSSWIVVRLGPWNCQTLIFSIAFVPFGCSWLFTIGDREPGLIIDAFHLLLKRIKSSTGEYLWYNLTQRYWCLESHKLSGLLPRNYVSTLWRLFFSKLYALPVALDLWYKKAYYFFPYICLVYLGKYLLPAFQITTLNISIITYSSLPLSQSQI